MNDIPRQKIETSPQEKINEELLIDLLTDCEPYVIEGTLELHKDKLLTLIENNVLEPNDLKQYLTAISKLRTQLDQEEARTNKEEFLNITKDLTVIIEELNTLVHYDLMPRPKLVQEFKKEKLLLLKNIDISGYDEAIISRVKKELAIYMHDAPIAAYQYADGFMQGLVNKLKKVNNSFTADSILPFTNKLSEEFKIHLS